MSKEAAITLTAEEAKLIVQFIRSTPIQGTIEQLPTVLTTAIRIVEKIDAAFSSQEG